MNLTISPLRQNQFNNVQNRQSFTANRAKTAMDTVENAVEQAANKDSSFFKPITDAYDKFTDGVAKQVTSRLLEFEPLHKLADYFKDSKKLTQHSMTLGSIITSGLYMQRTYTNKNLDEDRRNTLVVNQGLTLILSTAGAYMLDKYLNGWWNNVTARYAGVLLNDKDFLNNYKKHVEETAKANKPLKEALKRGEKVELKSAKSVMDMVKNNENYKQLEATDKAAAKLLKTKIKGMSPLKGILVFGFVYRFFVPVVVTKPANKLCDKYLQKKHEKEAQKAQNA